MTNIAENLISFASDKCGISKTEQNRTNAPLLDAMIKYKNIT